MPLKYTATFSMVALDKEKGKLGVCVATAVPAVGSRVPHVEAGVGAIATQALANLTYGIKGLQLLKMGFEPKNALDFLLREDPGREERQVFIIDIQGRTAAYTGRETKPWSGHKLGDDFVAGGNLLIGAEVIEAMVSTFSTTKGELEQRLMTALEAGQEAGGDRRGKRSAALVVEKKERGEDFSPYFSLRVDDHENPVAELRRIFEAYISLSS